MALNGVYDLGCYGGYCLHVTLEQYNKKAATGLSSRSVLARLSEIQMLDVTIPATDGREVRMRRYTKQVPSGVTQKHGMENFAYISRVRGLLSIAM